MLRTAILLLALLPAAYALVAGPDVYEQDDFGDPVLFDDFTYSLSMDCEAGVLNVTVYDENITPVEGATTYLKYVDITEPFLGQGITDAEGTVLHAIPGNASYMRGMFVLVLHKDGYRDKEVHFDLYPCWSGGKTRIVPPLQKPKPAAGTANSTNGSWAVQPSHGDAGNGTNATGNQSGTGNAAGTGNATSDAGNGLPSGVPLPCPAMLLLVLLLINLQIQSEACAFSP